MASALKKIESNGAGDLRAGERLTGGIFVNPDGFTGSLMATQLGGAVGGAINAGMRGSAEAPAGIASEFPGERCWIGITPQRVLVWSHGAVRGKPKDLIAEFPREQLTSVATTPRKTTHHVLLTFADGSTCSFEAPKIGNDPAAFAAAVNDA